MGVLPNREKHVLRQFLGGVPVGKSQESPGEMDHRAVMFVDQLRKGGSIATRSLSSSPCSIMTLVTRTGQDLRQSARRNSARHRTPNNLVYPPLSRLRRHIEDRRRYLPERFMLIVLVAITVAPVPFCSHGGHRVRPLLSLLVGPWKKPSR